MIVCWFEIVMNLGYQTKDMAELQLVDLMYLLV